MKNKIWCINDEFGNILNLEGFKCKGNDEYGTQLLIQGLGCECKTIWCDYVKSYANSYNKRNIISFDGRGIGKSDSEIVSSTQIVDDTVQVLLKEKPPYQLIGHSLGGMIALKVAERIPELVDSVILICSNPRYTKNAKKGFLWRADEIKNNNSIDCIFEKVIPRSFSRNFIQNEHEKVLTFKNMLNRQNIKNYCKLSLIASTVDALDVFQKLNIPILMIVGSEDPSITVEKTRKYADMINCDFKVIADSGHNIPLENPESLREIIENFDNLFRRF
ncbi:alpha/beta fold hydrolase [Enterococcus cecorum]|nr:alpha/beta fold hydrolase [Enterococcus cecorum]